MDGIICSKIHSTVVLIFAGFLVVRENVALYPTSCAVSLERGVRGSELADGCSGWLHSVSVPSFGFYLFEEKRSKCSLILAGGQRGSSGRRKEWRCEGCRRCWLETREANIRFISIKMYQRVFDLDLTLMSPQGTLRHCSPLVD